MPTIIPIPYNSNSTSQISDKDLLACYITLSAICLIVFCITYGFYLFHKHIKNDKYATYSTGFFDGVIYFMWMIITAIILFYQTAKFISSFL
jgi:hypothetical protein